ncbi:MAG: chromosome segregation protein SMC [Oscillospiraceae bacterium]|nr:chromosome segregation protein SMC [Oscillospiraceae bacterium]
MYLKSLELHGFKSFPDKVVLSFDKGLTGVVGPNGSGKSNIGDAVRWVLGEQSTKTLRGNKMEDVIFSGTTARKPAGFASVTLTIDNSTGELGTDDSEVAVTRKIYRNGDSEYKINGKTVRLKDINELFMDTGLGRDGYSIIGQGRIAEIVGARSTERRDIFEEAAGISKFRYKKAEAERRLTQAQDNLNRLTDILSELEDRVGPLKKQSEKAEKFLVLADERKKLELSLWIHDLEELGDALKKIEENSLIYTAQYENIVSQEEREEQSISEAYDKMREITLKIDEYKQLILDVERESSDYRSGIAVCENDIRHSEEMIASVRRQQENEENAKKAVAEKMEALKRKLAEGEQKIHDTEDELRAAEKSFKEIEEEAGRAEKESGDRESKLTAMYRKQNDLKFTIASASSRRDEFGGQLAELDSQNEELAKTLAGYEEDLRTAKETLDTIEEREKESENRLAGLSMMYKKKKTAFDERKQQFDDLTLELREKQQREKLLSDMENSMEGLNYSVKEILKAQKNQRITGIYGTVSQLITVDDEYTTAIETALGGALQNIIVKNEDTAKRCIALLKELKKGRATFLPVTSVKPYDFRENGVRNEDGFVALGDEIVETDPDFKNIMSNLLGRTVIAEDIDYASVIAKKYSYRFRIVTLDGQVINAGGSFTGGSAVQSGGILSRKNEINELAGKIKELEGSVSKVRDEAQKVRAEAEKLRLDIEAENDTKQKLNEDKLTFRSEIKSLESILAQSEQQNRNYSENRRRLEKNIAEAEEQFKSASEELEKITEELERAQSEVDSHQSLKEGLAEKRKQLSDHLYELKIRCMEAEKNCESIKLEISHCEADAGNLNQSAKELENQIAGHEKTISEKRAEIEKNRALLEKAAGQTEVYRNCITASGEQHDKYEAAISEKRAGLKKLGEDKERLSREMSRFEEKKVNTQRDYDSIITRLWENYELTRTEAENQAEKIENIGQAQKRLGEVRNSIKALGSINVAAIEEYKEVSERYEFLSAQLKDVENSKRELEKLIEELTSDMQRIFAENFALINKNFKEIFVDLFGGGKADLELTDPDNILESGIEIKVAPPGKVIKNLISLSGGEQAFVAIAIYFAILKIRPAPFCILDEIDAALDEVNVRKYAFYLKNFVSTTQFILVTHRRGTMELANVLYGVTMQQNGVSKLLKMNQVDIPDENDAGNA